MKLKLSYSLLTPFLLMVVSVYFVFHQAVMSAFLVWFYWPIFQFLMIGSFKERVVNTLSLFIALTHLILSLQHLDFVTYNFLFFLIPLGSLVLKPRKHPMRYITLGLTLIYLSVNYFTEYQISIWFKWSFISFIQVVFLPPRIKHWIKGMLHIKEKHVHMEIDE